MIHFKPNGAERKPIIKLCTGHLRLSFVQTFNSKEWIRWYPAKWWMSTRMVQQFFLVCISSVFKVENVTYLLHSSISHFLLCVTIFECSKTFRPLAKVKILFPFFCITFIHSRPKENRIVLSESAKVWQIVM